MTKEKSEFICPLDIGFLTSDPELSRQVVEAQIGDAEKKGTSDRMDSSSLARASGKGELGQTARKIGY